MRLKDWLTGRRMTGSDFADLISVDKSNVSRWINGHVRPEWDVIKRIKEATGGEVTADDFLDAVPAASDAAVPPTSNGKAA